MSETVKYCPICGNSIREQEGFAATDGSLEMSEWCRECDIVFTIQWRAVK